ncbi:MAG: glutathione S-transferase, partial [Planctomycetota bacterium]
TDDASAKSELEAKASNGQAPTLVCGDKTMQESADIISHLVACAAPL